MKGDSRRVTRWGDPSMETFTALESKNSSFGPKFRRNQGGLKSPMMAIGIVGQEFSRLCFEDDMFKQVKGHTFFADTDALEKIINDNLRRKRIYLEREKFDIMTILRQSMRDSSEMPPSRSDTNKKSRRDQSPRNSGNASSKGAPPPFYSNSI